MKKIFFVATALINVAVYGQYISKDSAYAYLRNIDPIPHCYDYDSLTQFDEIEWNFLKKTVAPVIEQALNTKVQSLPEHSGNIIYYELIINCKGELYFDFLGLHEPLTKSCLHGLKQVRYALSGLKVKLPDGSNKHLNYSWKIRITYGDGKFKLF